MPPHIPFRGGIGLVLLVLLLHVPGASAAARDFGEARALWVVRDALVSPASIRKMVRDAERAGVTDLFVQVRGRGDAYYTSSFEPPPDLLTERWRRDGRFDPLALVLDETRDRGLRVHAWINVFLVANASSVPEGHLLQRHPEWAARDARGISMADMTRGRFQKELTEGIYVDPSLSSVRDHVAAVCGELAANYALDGVHLDYVRYPHMDVGYTDAMRRVFRGAVGIDPLRLQQDRATLLREWGAGAVREADERWGALRAEQVTRLVRRVRETLRMTRPGMVLSAAVKPDADQALTHYGQDWVRWIEEDLVDVVAPMMYSTSTRTVRRQAEATASRVPPHRVWPGIAVYNQSLHSAAAKIETAQKAGFTGYSIFSYNSIPDGVRGLEKLNRAR